MENDGVPEVAAACDVQDSAGDPEDDMADDVEGLRERERAHVHRSEQGAGDQDGDPCSRVPLNELDEELPEEQLLHEGAEDPRDCDEEEGREHIRDAEDAVVVLQRRARQARDPQQEVGEPVAGGLGCERSDEARQQYQRRSASTGRDLPGRPGQPAAEAEASQAEQHHEECHADEAAVVARDQEPAQMEEEMARIDDGEGALRDAGRPGGARMVLAESAGTGGSGHAASVPTRSHRGYRLPGGAATRASDPGPMPNADDPGRAGPGRWEGAYPRDEWSPRSAAGDARAPTRLLRSFVPYCTRRRSVVRGKERSKRWDTR